MRELPCLYKKKEECCGCAACYAICPRTAIRMAEDEKGFAYPEIDPGLCIRCHMCLRVCPFSV